jgi:hypothetical protein
MSVVDAGFYSGHTAQVVRDAGRPTLLLYHYLVLNRFTNMIGLYRLTRGQIARDIALRDDELDAAWSVIDAEDFAHYDGLSDSVFVVNMARVRIAGLVEGRPPTISQISTVRRLCAKAVDNFFYPQFFDRYGARFRLNPLGDDAPDPKPSGRNVALLSKYLGTKEGTTRVRATAEPQKAAVDVTPTLPFDPTRRDLDFVARDAIVKAELRYEKPTVADYTRTFEELLRRYGVRR